MSQSSIQGLLSAITTTKGALLTAPAVVGVGLLLSLADPSAQRAAHAEAKQATEPAAAQTATTREEAQPLVLAQAKDGEEKPPKGSSSGNPVTSSFTPAQREELGKLIRSYLLKNPEILQEVGEELARRQREEQDKARLKVLASSKDEIFKSPIDFALGDKDADVTIVEYFDYNCGWCKRALNEVTKLAEQDKKIRIVMKEFPIFGEHSEFAARAALAAKPQGKYWDFHVALMKERRVTKDNVLEIAARVGIDVDQLKEEMKDPKYEAAIRKTQQIAASLGIEGTPGFVVDSRVNPGYLPADQLKAMVADVRKNGCQFC